MIYNITSNVGLIFIAILLCTPLISIMIYLVIKFIFSGIFNMTCDECKYYKRKNFDYGVCKLKNKNKQWFRYCLRFKRDWDR